MVREFAEKKIASHLMEWDEKKEFPINVINKLGEL